MTPTSTLTALTLSAIAGDLAPMLYRADCAFTGCAETAVGFADLPADQQARWRTRAETAILTNCGAINSHAEALAIRRAIVEFALDECAPALQETMERAIDFALTELPRCQQQIYANRRVVPYSRHNRLRSPR